MIVLIMLNLALYFPLIVRAGEASKINAQEIISKLDVTSFPSSIGPRRQKEKIRFADYGAKPTQVTGNSAILEEAKEWRFKIKVLSSSDSDALICFEDQAIAGPSYHTQSVLSLVRSSDRQTLIAEKKKVTNKDCPEFAK